MPGVPLLFSIEVSKEETEISVTQTIASETGNVAILITESFKEEGIVLREL